MSRTSQLAIPLTSLPSEAIGIAAVERETGLSKDTLRVWERRYGFPNPLRDGNGERIYPTEQIEKLRLLHRLIEQGMRPGKIIGLDLATLERLGGPQSGQHDDRPELKPFLNLLRDHNISELRRQFGQALMRQGLQAFILDTLVPLNERVLHSLISGDLDLFEEHFYAEQVQATLRSAIHSVQHDGNAPRVIIASPATEVRAGTRLMLEALLTIGGAICIPLGAETPGREIARAATAHRANVVVLTFDSCPHDTGATLCELRTLVSRAVHIWAFGAGLGKLRKRPDGIACHVAIGTVTDMLRSWKTAHGK